MITGTCGMFTSLIHQRLKDRELHDPRIPLHVTRFGLRESFYKCQGARRLVLGAWCFDVVLYAACVKGSTYGTFRKITLRERINKNYFFVLLDT